MMEGCRSLATCENLLSLLDFIVPAKPLKGAKHATYYAHKAGGYIIIYLSCDL